METNSEAYLPVFLSLVKLHLRSIWHTAMGGEGGLSLFEYEDEYGSSLFLPPQLSFGNITCSLNSSLTNAQTTPQPLRRLVENWTRGREVRRIRGLEEGARRRKSSRHLFMTMMTTVRGITGRLGTSSTGEEGSMSLQTTKTLSKCVQSPLPSLLVFLDHTPIANIDHHHPSYGSGPATDATQKQTGTLISARKIISRVR